MPTEVTLPNGDILEVPDSASPADISVILQNMRLPEQTAAPQSSPPLSTRAPRNRTARPGGSSPAVENLNALGQGINRIIPEVLGAPADLGNFLAGLVPGVDVPERPLLGSERIRDTMADAGMTFRDMGEVPETARPFAVAGESVGQALPFAMAPFAAARAGVQGGRFLGPIIDTARRAPGATAAVEAGGIGGAAAGAGLAEAIDPGNPTSRLAGEVAGGLAAPVSAVPRAVSSGLGRARSAVDRLRGFFSQSGREATAARALQETVGAFGEDSTELAARLQSGQPVEGATLTPAQITESPALIGLERRLARDNPQLDQRLREGVRQTAQDFERLLRQATESGDPDLVRQVAQERVRFLSDLVDARLTSAEQQARNAVAALRPNTTRGEAGVAVRSILEDALSDARAVERELWQAVPSDTRVTADATTAAFDAARARLLPEETLPAPIEAFVNRVRNRDDLTAGDLLRARSRILALQRDIRSGQNVDWTGHRALGEVADGILDDLAGVPGTDEARAYSRNLNDLFSRGEVGRIMGFASDGGSRVAPEMTLERAIGAGGTRGNVASREIEDAARFGGQPSTLPAQEDFLRNLTQRLVGPDGTISERGLNTFRTNNREMLSRFPGLDAELQNAASASALLRQTRQARQQAQKALNDLTALQRVANTESPSRAISAILRGPQPIAGYRQILSVARQGGPDAVSGLRGATFDALFEQARLPNGMISGERLSRLLNSSATPNAPSLRQVMRENGVMTRAQALALDKVIDAASRVERAQASGARVSEALSDATMLEDLLTRIVGANIGSQTAAGNFSGLVAAQAGSQAARRLTQQLPLQRTQELLARAVEDPALMSALLSRGSQVRPGSRPSQVLNAWLLGTVIPDDETPQRSQQPSRTQPGFMQSSQVPAPLVVDVPLDPGAINRRALEMALGSR